jgi:DNA-binding CsgD family transcriptional regulator
MEYPEEFSPEARARVEAEKAEASTALEEAKGKLTLSFFGTLGIDAVVTEYILRVFVAFVQEAGKLGRKNILTVERIESESLEFLRRLTIETWYEKGRDKVGRQIVSMVNDRGQIRSHVQREYEKSAQWRQYQNELLAVAHIQTAAHSGSSADSNPAIDSRLKESQLALERSAKVLELIRSDPEAAQKMGDHLITKPADIEKRGEEPSAQLAETCEKAEPNSPRTTPKPQPIGFEGLGKKEVSPYIAGAPLTDRQRDCAHLKWDYQLTDTEIASRLGISRATVEEHLKAANKRIANTQSNAKQAQGIKVPSEPDD